MGRKRGQRNAAKEKFWPGQDAALVRAEKHGVVTQTEQRAGVNETEKGSTFTPGPRMDAGSTPASPAIILDCPPSDLASRYRKDAASGEIVIRPNIFKTSRFHGGLWLNHRTHWGGSDVMVLHAACDLGVDYEAAANTLGRPPHALAHKALGMRVRIPKSWRPLVYNYQKKEPRLNLQYPYVVKPDSRHDDLIAVNRLVSQAIPGREDVCQDVMLALWQSRTSLAELRTDPRALKSFIRAFRKASFERGGYGVESMDVTIHSHDGGDGKTKYEDARYQRTLADQDDQFIEWSLFGKRHAEDYTIDNLSAEEESLGVPAAFWARANLA